MKSLVYLLDLFLFSLSIAFPQKPDFDVYSYEIESNLSLSKKSLEVSLVCNIELNNNPGSLRFLFSSEADLHSVNYLESDRWVDISFIYNGKDSLQLIADRILSENKINSLKFDYSFPVKEFNDTVLIFDRGNRWYPLINNEIFTYTLKCEVPANYRMLSSGNLIEEKTTNGVNRFIYECDKPVFKLPLIIFNPGMYTNTKLNSDGTDIEFYSLTADSSVTIEIMSEADRVLNYFNQTIGEYVRNKLIYFEVSDFGGINVGSGLLSIGTQIINWSKKGYDDMLILTIAQQWFTAGVFADFNQPGFFFLTISLPHYLKLMYIRNELGEAAYNNSLLQTQEAYKEFAGKEIDIPLIDVDMPNTKEKGLLLYGKGPFVLSKIESELGKDNWKSFIKELYITFNGKIMTYNDFKEYLSKFDQNKKALPLFEKLMNEKGFPD